MPRSLGARGPRPVSVQAPRRPDEIAAATVYLASEYADYVHGTTLTSTAAVAPSDRPVLSGGSTALLWLTGACRIVGP